MIFMKNKKNSPKCYFLLFYTETEFLKLWKAHLSEFLCEPGKNEPGKNEPGKNEPGKNGKDLIINVEAQK